MCHFSWKTVPVEISTSRVIEICNGSCNFQAKAKIQFLKVNLTSLVSVLRECEEKMYYDDDDGGKYHIIILRLGSCIYSK